MRILYNVIFAEIFSLADVLSGLSSPYKSKLYILCTDVNNITVDLSHKK